jgi:mannose PTS system EIIA component
MIQILVVTHGGLARELIHTAQLIVGAQPDVEALCLEMHEGIEDLQQKLSAALKPVPGERAGALVLVDMFGGTPSNVALALSTRLPLRVVTGANLPMLLEAITHRALLDLPSLAALVTKKGKQSVIDASERLSAGNPADV